MPEESPTNVSIAAKALAEISPSKNDPRQFTSTIKEVRVSRHILRKQWQKKWLRAKLTSYESFDEKLLLI